MIIRAIYFLLATGTCLTEAISAPTIGLIVLWGIGALASYGFLGLELGQVSKKIREKLNDSDYED